MANVSSVWQELSVITGSHCIAMSVVGVVETGNFLFFLFGASLVV